MALVGTPGFTVYDGGGQYMGNTTSEADAITLAESQYYPGYGEPHYVQSVVFREVPD